MRSTYLDLAPYRRATVGFDRLFDMMNSMRLDADDNYPPYDIERNGEDSYRITLAVAGFRPDDIEVVAQQNVLTVTGHKADERGQPERHIHKAIATRSFERRFQLADHVEVQSANFENGLLTIDLRREVPEAMKPRKIEIGTQPRLDPRRVEQQAAA